MRLYHSGNLLLEKGFLLYVYVNALVLPKNWIKKGFLLWLRYPSLVSFLVKVEKSPQKDFLLWLKQPFVCIFVFKQENSVKIITPFQVKKPFLASCFSLTRKQFFITCAGTVQVMCSACPSPKFLSVQENGTRPWHRQRNLLINHSWFSGVKKTSKNDLQYSSNKNAVSIRSLELWMRMSQHQILWGPLVSK